MDTWTSVDKTHHIARLINIYPKKHESLRGTKQSHVTLSNSKTIHMKDKIEKVIEEIVSEINKSQEAMDYYKAKGGYYEQVDQLNSEINAYKKCIELLKNVLN